MKMLRSGFLLLSLIAFACTQKAAPNTVLQETETAKAGSAYVNPVYSQNFPDPTAIQAADGFYYVYGTNTDVDGRTVHIQVARSENMTEWQPMGDALPVKPSWANSDFWAPHVRYDEMTETYYLYYSGESNSNTVGKCLGVATAKSPTGPFVDRGEPLLCGEGFINIDPMAFDDPATGRKLLYWGSGFGPIQVQELADDRLSFKAGSKPIAVVQPVANEDPSNYERLIEGAWVFYRNGFYYMLYSGDNCCGEKAHYAVMVARARTPTGPFQKMAEATGSESSVILARNSRWIAPGHNAVITDKAGQDWMLYHAIDSANSGAGRVMLLDKVTYINGWPQVATGTPSVTAEPAPATFK